MPIGYHRDVCAASRTEAPSDLIRARFAAQTFAGKSPLTVASPHKRGVWPPYRGHAARQRPPNNLEAPGLPSKGRAPRHGAAAAVA
jgi:hypothetical protein